MVRVLVAAGLLLVAAALGALLSTNPTLVPVVLADGLVAFALAAILNVPAVRRRVRWLQTEQDRAVGLRMLLGDELEIGLGLLQEANLLAMDDLARIAALRSRAEAWGARVVGELDQRRRGWSAIFMTDPIVIPYGTSAERDKVLRWLQQRVTALRGLLERVS